MGQLSTVRSVRVRWLGSLILVLGTDAAAVADVPAAPWRLRFLIEAGAEAMTAGASALTADPVVMAGVPGSAYLFDRDASGIPRRRAKLAVDSAAAHDAVVLADGSAVVAGRDGTLSRFSPGTAVPAWRRELGERVASLASGSGRLIASTWANRVWAVAEDDGRVLWRAELGAKSEAPAVIDDGGIYIGTKSRTLVALDPARGVIRWKAELPGPVLHVPALSSAAPRSVYCITWDGTLLAHDVVSGRVRWSMKLPARAAGGPALLPGVVAVPTEDGAVRAFADATGAARWEAAAAAQGPATLIAQSRADGVRRFVAVSRRLTALDPEDGRRLSEYPEGAREDLRRRFAQAMIEAEKTYSEAEKRAIEETEAFAIEGALFGAARASASGIAFGTEDGWLYLFDSGTLRPKWRYRAAAPSAAAPAADAARVLTTAGTELMAIDPATGTVSWKRDLGADIESVLPAGEDVAVVASGRLTFVRAADGSVAARASGKLRGAVPQDAAAGAWLADDGRHVRLLLRASSWNEVDALDLGGETLAPVAHDGGWAVATRAGTITGLAAEAPAGGAGARLTRRWTASVGEPVTEMRAAGTCLVFRTAAGPLVGFEPATGQARWRQPLPAEAEWSVGGGDLLVYQAGELAVHDACTGTRQVARRVEAAPLIGVRRGADLVWLDARGRLHRATAEPASQAAHWDIGLSPARAALANGGFVIKTATGETGFLEISGW